MFSQIMTGKFPPLPNAYLPFVDVRDVSKAHFVALEKGKNCNRYALTEGTYTIKEMADHMAEEFKPKGYKTRTSMAPKCLVAMMSCCNKDAKTFNALWGIRCHVKNDKAKKDLGMDFRCPKQGAIDMCNTFIELEMVPPPKK